MGSDEGRASAEKLLRALEINDLKLQPRAIHIENGIALAHYVVILTTVGEDGQPVETTYRLTHTWVRENGSWKILGGMSAEVAVGD